MQACKALRAGPPAMLVCKALRAGPPAMQACKALRAGALTQKPPTPLGI